VSRSTWPTAALGALVTLGALVALTGTAGAQQNLAGATQLELTVTVKPGGGTAVTGGDTSNGYVTRNVMFALPCGAGIDKSSFRVKAEIGDAPAAEAFFLSKSAAHFKGMNKFVWSLETPVAALAPIVAACPAGAKPTARAIFEIKYTCAGAAEKTFFNNLPFTLVCPPAPAPASAAPGNGSLDPTTGPIEPNQPRPTACRQNTDCPRGTFCARDGFCRR
jgi:hypothetical protein